MTVTTTSAQCPQCGNSKVYCNGHRVLSDGTEAQRYLCRSCGFRFTDPKTLKIVPDNNSSSQICVNEAKNLANVQTRIEKICTGENSAKLPQETRGLLAKYLAYLEREGFYNETSYYDLLSSLAHDGANLLDPEDVKEKIARHTYIAKDGKRRQWKNSTRMLATYAYDAFCKMQGITWSKPKYRQEESQVNAPDEKDLDALIMSARSKRMATFLQCLKETYCDPSEILALEWREIKENVIFIVHPCKGHRTGHYTISGRLISMLSALPKNDKRVFPTTYTAMLRCLNSLKKKTANRLQRPQILDITFKSFRHWGGSMLAYYHKGNAILVQKELRHKSINNTMKYIHTVHFADSDFEVTTATKIEEIQQLGKEGWTKYDEGIFNSTTIHFYRKPKRFIGAN